MNFTHLHNHSYYSLMDGLNSPRELLEAAKAKGQTHMAITDHGTLSGNREFQVDAKELGVKPILGIEAYISPTDRFDRRPVKKRDDNTQAYNHIILIAKDAAGYKNLNKLSEIAWTEGFYSKPRIDREVLTEYRDGIIVLSGCMNGLIAKAIERGEEGEAKLLTKWFKETFEDNFYMEIQPHNPADLNNKMIELAGKYGIQPVVTNDCHFAYEEDKWREEAMLILSTGPKATKIPYEEAKKVGRQEGIFARLNALYPDRPISFADINLFVADREFIGKGFSDEVDYRVVEQALDTTMVIAESIGEYEYHEGLDLLPRPKASDPDALLRKKTYEGLRKRGIANDPGVKERAEEELEILTSKNFSPYMLMVANCTSWARSKGIRMGKGRGSSVGSLVCYALYITDINPLEHNLLFFRFINPERNDFPDIDIDFQDTRRYEVKDYMRRQYKNVGSIATFTKFQGKNSVRDAARVFMVPLADVNRGLKGADYPANVDFFEHWLPTPRGSEFAKKYPEVVDLARYLHGRTRSIGVHPGGIVIANRPLNEVAPIQSAEEPNNPSSTRVPVVAHDMNEAERIGLVKQDILGLKSLSVVEDTLNVIKERSGVELDLDAIPLDDERVYKMISDGYTRGVFQCEEGPYTGMLIKMGGVSNFDELVASNALVRPGAMDSSAGAKFIARKNGQQAVSYPHEDMKWFTEETYGTCIFQEQKVMTPFGPVRIADLNVGDTVQGESGLGEITHKVNMGVKPVYNVTLSNGTVIRCTNDHKFLTPDGYRPVAEIVGGLVASPKRVVSLGNVHAPEKARTLAALIAEGHLPSRSSFNVANNDEAILSQLESDAKVFDNVGTRRYWSTRCNYLSYFKQDRHLGGYHSPSDIKLFIRDMGLEGKNSHTKFIPKWVFELDEESRAAFAGMYISCDGFVSRNCVKVRTVSRDIAEGLVSLLKTLGIHARITVDSDGLNVFVLDFQAFRSVLANHIIGNKSAVVVDAESRRGYAPNIVLGLQAESGLSKRRFDKQHCTSRGSYSKKEVIGRDFAERFGYQSDYIWNRIVSVEYAGFNGVVYDITVSGQHSFIVGETIVHNCIFQEQVMLTMTELAGMPMATADKVRKIIGKKRDVAEFEQYREEFIEGASNKVHRSIAELLWKDFEAHANYSFNKSHAVAYSMLSYQTAWLKVNYPVEFMYALLKNEKEKDSRTDYFIEAKRLGVRIVLPHVNESDVDFSIQSDSKGDFIRFGLANIKYLSTLTAPRLINRRPFGRYRELEAAVLEKGSGLNTRMLQALNAVGAAEFQDNPLRGDERENLFEYLSVPAFKGTELPPKVKMQFRPLDDFTPDETFVVSAMVRKIKTGPGWARLDLVDESGSAGVFTDENTMISTGDMYVFLISNNRVSRYIPVDDVMTSDSSFAEYLLADGFPDVPEGMQKVVSFKTRTTKAGKKMADGVFCDEHKNLTSAMIFPQQFHKAFGKCKEGAVVDIMFSQTDSGAIFVQNIL